MNTLEITKLMRVNGYNSVPQDSEAVGSAAYLREDLDREALEHLERKFRHKRADEIEKIWESFGENRGEVMRRISRAISRRYGGVTETLNHESGFYGSLNLND